MNRINVVHINNSFKIDLYWMVVPKILYIKCVCHQRGFVESRVKIASFRRWIINHWLDKVICISQAIEEDCRKHRIFNTTVIYNGLDEQDFVSQLKGLDWHEKFSFSKDDYPIVGIIGNIKRWKGQHVVIEAIALLKETFPRIRCLIIGEPPQKEKSNKYFQSIHQKVTEYSLIENVIFTGFRNDIPDLISGLDILLHASVDPEPFGRVLLEGMALKKPVIATAHGGPMEIIDSGKSGILVPPENPTALANAIKTLTEDKKLAIKIGLEGHKQFTNTFNSKINVEKTEILYEELLSS